jgi:DNA/RNA-binding domain of Phe-tRNA-synthetase-like protein
MYFCHSSEIWTDFPNLVPGLIWVDRITRDTCADPQTGNFMAAAESRLAAGSEGALPEVQAWRRVFSKMGLKPTQYRCASESLLRRFRKDRSLPRLHPVIDLCNAASLAFAIPVAVFDVSKISEYLEVRYASGSERYLTFSGETETPEPREVIFADGSGRAHARRWSNRQSGYSAVRDETTTALIVAEAVHESADSDVRNLLTAIANELKVMCPAAQRTGILTKSSPRFEF